MPLSSRIPAQAWSIPVDHQLSDPPKPKFGGLHDLGYHQGLPIGGLGTGGIGHNYRGSFSRWTVKAGVVRQFCEPANIFAAYQKRHSESKGHAQVLHPGYPTAYPVTEPVVPRGLKGWNWPSSLPGATYHALFPKAWYHYAPTADYPVEMLCEQFSPVIPHNYRETAYPIGLFVWTLHNPTLEPVDCSLMFSFVNMVGWFAEMGRDQPWGRSGSNINHAVSRDLSDGSRMRGILFAKEGTNNRAEGNGEMCIAALENGRIRVSHHATLHTAYDGADVWGTFSRDGTLDDSTEAWVSEQGEVNAGVIASSCTVQPGETLEVPMTLTWDLPVIQFGGGTRYFRRYTKYWGVEGTHAAEMAGTALESRAQWSQDVDSWHRGVTSASGQPGWFDGMRFNELYLLVDGLTIWTDKAVDGGAAEDFFGLIECPDYAYYNTFDLWVYGSFVFAAYWPEIERSVIRLFAKFLMSETRLQRKHFQSKKLFPMHRKGFLLHDMGAPLEDPVNKVNTYVWQDSTRWKDLNSHFVVTVYRDVRASGDDALAREWYPAVKMAIGSLTGFDRDGDGLIENDNLPDQTFDNIPMHGPSSYCGGLWLAALAAGVEMARMCGDAEAQARFGGILARGKQSFDDALWTGTHYRVDTKSTYRDNVFIEQMFGIWYAARCGLGDLLPVERIRTALRTVYRSNFLGVDNGTFGVMNIKDFTPDMTKEISVFGDATTQTDEVMSGINLSFANQLEHYGLVDEATAVRRAIHRGIYEKGLWFRTPAAWTRDNKFRAVMNMRALVIWAGNS